MLTQPDFEQTGLPIEVDDKLYEIFLSLIDNLPILFPVGVIHKYDYLEDGFMVFKSRIYGRISSNLDTLMFNKIGITNKTQTLSTYEKLRVQFVV